MINTARNIKGKSFRELDEKTRLKDGKTKGIFGHIIEESVFNYDINSSSEADFKDINVELKVTPVKKLKKGNYSAKERLVLNIINYEEEYRYTFYDSAFWKKNQSLLLMFYLFDPEKSFEDYVILDSILYEYPVDDLAIIKKDREIIIQKIKDGKAHQISEKDTMYLGACPKGSSSRSLRKQPFSDVRAMQRAYSFKSGYMTQIIRKYVMGHEENEKIIKDPSVLNHQTFNQYVLKHIEPYLNQSLESLKKHFNIDSNAKSINAQVISKIMGVSNIAKSDEFLKANIKIKTIQQTSKGIIKESMSFPAFEYKSIVQETWEDSELRDMFSTTKWLFVVFQKTQDEVILKRAFFWSMPNETLETEVKDLWMDTVEKIRNGTIYNFTNNRGQRITHFWGSKDTQVAHVRPHGINKNDTFPIPVTDQKLGVNEYTKSCFWLNSKYIKQIVESHT